MFERLEAMPPAARRVVFAVLAVLLVGAAVLALRGGSDTPDTGSPAAPGAGTGNQPAPAGTGVAAAPATTTPAPNPSDVLTLPVDQQEITRLAAKARQFAMRYTSYRYDQDNNTWSKSLTDMLSKTNLVDVDSLLPTGEAAAQLKTEKWVVTSKATQVKIDFIMDGSVQFVVAVEKTITNTSGTSTEHGDYNVTLFDDGATGWGVSEFQAVDSDDHDHAGGE